MKEYRSFDWTDEISYDGEGFTMIEPGDYDFEITDIEKTKTARGDNMAKLTIKVYDGESQGSITDNIVLNEKCEWKISQFFRSIGLKKHGQTIHMDWNRVQGAKGRLRVKKDSFTGRDGVERESRAVDRYFDPVQADDDVPW